MPPKQRIPSSSQQPKTPSPAPQTSTPSKATPTPSKPAPAPSKQPRLTTSGSIRNSQDIQQITTSIWNNYQEKTPQRTKLLDAFMAFLVTVGVLQFVYCVLVGNYVRHTILSAGWLSSTSYCTWQCKLMVDVF